MLNGGPVTEADIEIGVRLMSLFADLLQGRPLAIWYNGKRVVL